MTLEEFRKKVTYKSHVKNYRILGNPKAMHLVYDPGSFRIVCFSPWISTVNTLNETKVNTVARYWQNYQGYSVLPAGCSVKQAYLCKWDDTTNKWVLTEDDFSEEELYSFCLMIEKAAVLDEMYQRILHYRRPIMNSIHMQDAVYQLKYDEAVEISKASAEDLDDPWQWPLVNDYANLQNVDIKTAAEEIIFKNKIFKTRLSNTETIRIKYTREIKACEKLEDLDGIINRFYTEGEIYGRL
jgi:hypothetical protein